LLGQWSVSVPRSVAAQAQVPAGAWNVVTDSSTVVAEPVGQPADRIVEQVNAGAANSHVVTFNEAAGGGFNFACAGPGTYSWQSVQARIRWTVRADGCTARRLFLALPWRRPSG
jgi:hypothetical protein